MSDPTRMEFRDQIPAIAYHERILKPGMTLGALRDYSVFSVST